LKTDGRLVKHAHYYSVILAESHLTRRLFASKVRRIEVLAVRAGIGKRCGGKAYLKNDEGDDEVSAESLDN